MSKTKLVISKEKNSPFVNIKLEVSDEKKKDFRSDLFVIK